MRTMATLERSTAACSGRTKDGDKADHEHRHIRDASSSSPVQEISLGEVHSVITSDDSPPASPLQVTPREVLFDFDQDPLQALLKIHHKGIIADDQRPMMAFRFRSYPADETHERFLANSGIAAPNTTETAAIVLRQRTQLMDADHHIIPEWIVIEYCPVSTALAKSYADMIQAEGREKADDALNRTWNAAEFFMEGDSDIGDGSPHVHRRKLRVRYTRNCPIHHEAQ